MRLLLCHIVCVCSPFCPPVTIDFFQDEKIYTVSEVSIKPEPVIGHDSFQKKWSNKVTYPDKAIKNNVQGMVFIQFVVDKDGRIYEASVRSGLGFGCDEAALEAFKELTRDAWKPGVKNDQPVKVRMVLPFQFRILKL